MKTGMRLGCGIVLLVLTTVSSALFLTGVAAATSAASMYSYTGGEQTYIVPTGVTAITVTAIGAPGGNGPENTNTIPVTGVYPAGKGASVTATVAVTPGQTLYVEVGGPGGETDCTSTTVAPAFNGGGGNGCGGAGGGASDVRTCSMATCSLTTSDTRLVVAGGGGGEEVPPLDVWVEPGVRLATR